MNLALIDLAGNAVTDLTPLRGLELPPVDRLHRQRRSRTSPRSPRRRGCSTRSSTGTEITDLAPLAGLEKLAALYLAENAVTDLGPLKDSKKLTSLDVSKNKITDAGPLAGLPYLSAVTLSGNELTDVTPLAALPDVRFLILEENQIEDLSPLVTAAAEDAAGPRRFAPYLRLYLDGNPLSDAARTEQLPALRDAGVTVDLGEPEAEGDAEPGGGGGE